MRELRFLLFVLAISLVTLSSCDKNNGDGDVTKKFLVDYEQVAPSTPFSVDNAKSTLKALGYSEIADLMKYEIQTYKITYKTEFEGDTIMVSGVVAAPVPTDKKVEFPIMSYQHGTIILKADAPSLNLSGSLLTGNIETEIMKYVASTGVVVVMSDYVGFGASASEFHPYMNKEYTVNAVLDMIRASNEFIAIEKPCDTSGKLFLFGYSQGASATLAALSAIENNNANSDITVAGTSCGSGAYDLALMRGWIMKQARYEQPFYIAYIMESFKKYSGVDVAYSDVFSEEFAEAFPALLDGTKSGSQINDYFQTTHKGEIFADDFEDDAIVESDAKYASLLTAFDENKVNAWQTTSSVWLFYGSEDLWVPGEQSVKMLQQFQSAGSGANIKLKRVDNSSLPSGMEANHVNTFIPALTQSLEWFLSE